MIPVSRAGDVVCPPVIMTDLDRDLDGFSEIHWVRDMVPVPADLSTSVVISSKQQSGICSLIFLG